MFRVSSFLPDKINSLERFTDDKGAFFIFVHTILFLFYPTELLVALSVATRLQGHNWVNTIIL